MLDYTAVKDHPKYAEALTSLGITEDAVFGDSHFFLGKKEIPTLQAYALAQNYVFLSNQCPTSSAAEIKEAAQTFYNKGFVITGGPIRFGDFDTKNSPVNITFVNILDLNEKGQLSIDKMMIYGFSPNKDAIYSDMYEKYDDVASNYTGSLDLRVNTVEFLFSGLSYVEHDNWDERLYGSYVWLEEKTSFPEFLKSRKEGLENKCKSEHTKQINGGNVADNLEELENIYRGRYDSLVDLVDRKAAAGRDDRVGGIAAALGEARAIYPNIKWVENFEEFKKFLKNNKKTQ